MENPDEEAGYQVPCCGPCHHQNDAKRTIPSFYIPNGFRGMRFLNHIHNVGPAD